MAKIVTAVFKSRAAASEAVEDLVDAGFSRDDISVLMSDETRGREFAVETGTKAAEGATTGGITGGILGAIAAGLAAVGAVVIPGVGLVAAGPLVAALAGAGAGGAVGGLIGALIGAGLPEHEAKFLSEEVKKGGILIGVYAHDDRKEVAERALERAGGMSIKS
ncbi:MAG: general stress protein [Candidatus Eisenbacteria bacterium]|nr:general stress protein [Candidatus Eisenbacteria bacterium]